MRKIPKGYHCTKSQPNWSFLLTFCAHSSTKNIVFPNPMRILLMYVHISIRSVNTEFKIMLCRQCNRLHMQIYNLSFWFREIAREPKNSKHVFPNFLKSYIYRLTWVFGYFRQTSASNHLKATPKTFDTLYRASLTRVSIFKMVSRAVKTKAVTKSVNKQQSEFISFKNNKSRGLNLVRTKFFLKITTFDTRWRVVWRLL